ncbi:hypothetical protein [Roseivirga thermotolerans]|uniref:SD-repeat containing protein B domain-containing protein n=1 Tax=Roseivirga thermotolerans TaxID=1758176 RepID=A0ABQ3ICE5_9BACT|nr:hypothetical protein [Roseivirga thermotolerans]GHE74403.1 hypothetical protein GCM10011340_33660 [Roseivirga thermotolerans]
MLQTSVVAQERTASGLTLQFLKSQTSGSVDEVASNVLKVVNRTGRTSVFKIEIATPPNWSRVRAEDQVYNVANNDSLFIPIRVVPEKSATGNVNYFINATALTTNGIPLASTPWSMQVVKVSRWFASIVKSEVFFPADKKEAQFQVNLKNNGNSAEDVMILFNPDVKVKILDMQGNPFADNSLPLKLPVDIDTTLTFTAQLDEEAKKENFFTAGAIDSEQTDQSEYKVNIQVKDVAGNRASWGGRVDFKKLNQEHKFKTAYGSSTIPINLEFNTYNVLSQFTNFSLDLSGEADLGEDRFLRYYYQTIISSNSLAGTQFLGSYRFAEYRTPKYSVSAGDIGQNMELLLNGTGVKGSYYFDKVGVSAIYVTRPQNGNVQNNLNSMGASVRYRVFQGLNATAELVNQDDQFNQVNRNLATLRANYRLPNQSIVDVKVGYSTELHEGASGTFSVPGFGATARYTGRIQGVSLSAQGRYNSPNYSSQFRGSVDFNTNARYNLGETTYVGLRVNMNSRNPEIYSKGILFPRREFVRNTFEGQYGWATENGNFMVYPRYTYEEVLDLRTSTTGMGLSFSTNKSSDARLFTRFFSGFTKALDYNMKPYLVSRWENTLRYKNLNVSARYYYGPFNVLDNLRVVEDGINPQSLFLSAFAQLNFTKARISVRPMFTMAYESVLARWRANMAPQVTYFSKSGLEFNMTVEYFSIKQGESPLANVSEFGTQAFNPFSQSNAFLRFGIKKQFNLKKPGKKAHDLEVVVFKDLNGNNLRDQGEEFERNVIVRVNGQALMTNQDGVVYFRNLPEGKYFVETELLTNSEGWFKSKGVEVDVNSSQAVYIPLKRGVQIMGNIILQKAQYSALGEGGMKLNGIRVTATDATGESYSTLTDLQGSFRLYVPFGQYTIKVNEQAVDSQFEFAQSSYTLDINNLGGNYQLAFYLIEKRRQLNIKRFDNN